ncbi:MAG: fucose isomerase [Candidatus Hydrogenedentota bacterium]|nr:MAG: fucose isomerase [Candidatus Hydrogenedentota bacterium]
MVKSGIKVGILTFGDGRDFLAEPLREVNEHFLRQLSRRLEDSGHEVITGTEVIWRNEIAVREAKRMAAADVDVVIYNYSVWAWPQYARLAAQFLPQPVILFSNVNPEKPGLVAMLAHAGSLDQVGISFCKLFGDIMQNEVLEAVNRKINAIAAKTRLRGKTFALIGGRSLGIDTTVSDPALWMKLFGIDVDHVDQFEVYRRAEEECRKGERVNAALDYLKKKVRKIHWTKPDAQMRLTEDLLRKQLGMYYAVYDLCEEFNYDFCGIKGQREMTEHYATADVAEAFLNDPYGPEGEPKRVIVCSTEADMDAALTMQVLHHLSGTPVLFADVRHYHQDVGVWDLCNSGQHATYFAGKSFDPEVNLAKTEFRPEGFYFPAGGAAVFHIAHPGKMTLARLTRGGDTNRYRMTFFTGECKDFGEEKNMALAEGVQDNWPHAFLEFSCSMREFIDNFHCNHIHAVYGDYREELREFCRCSGIEAVELGLSGKK